jgi:predicted AlkP superfamily pyrophosphatase or phosphodiesterase
MSRRRLIVFLTIFLLAATGAVVLFWPRPKIPKVLIIGIDGCRVDALQMASAPRLAELISRGTVSWNAVAGGRMQTLTHQQTVSGPGWSSILCGVWIDKHKVVDNKFTNHNLANYPHFFRRLKQAKPESVVASFSSWIPLTQFILATAQPVDIWSGVDKNKSYPEQDVEMLEKAVASLRRDNADVTFAYFNNVDETGHATGFGPQNPAYLDAIAGVDAHIGRLIDAIRSRKTYKKEDWLILLTTDHGGIKKGHGGDSVEERTIFLIASGGKFPAGHVSIESPGHVIVPRLVLEHLKVPVDPAWGWEEETWKLPEK